ncbi:hypothetical protein ACKKBG_A06170 [Auxenochlorella protothecoides x Auxenochlorella symbiontica]
MSTTSPCASELEQTSRGDAEPPKRPKSAFLCFLSHYRAIYKTAYGGRCMHQRSMCAAAGEAWRGMDAAAREPYVAESDASKIAWSHYMASPEAKVSRKSVGPQGKTPSRAPSRQTGRTPAPTPASTPPPLLFERALAPQDMQQSQSWGSSMAHTTVSVSVPSPSASWPLAGAGPSPDTLPMLTGHVIPWTTDCFLNPPFSAYPLSDPAPAAQPTPSPAPLPLEPSKAELPNPFAVSAAAEGRRCSAVPRPGPGPGSPFASQAGELPAPLSLPNLGSAGLPNLGSLGLPNLGSLGLPNLGSLGLPSVESLGLGALGLPQWSQGLLQSVDSRGPWVRDMDLLPLWDEVLALSTTPQTSAWPCLPSVRV